MAWDEILGHDTVKRMWHAHLTQERVPNAYLLAGPEGIGKRRLAFEMAKALNCTSNAARPCDICPTCLKISKQTHPDVHVLVPGGASQQIRIEDIRHVIGRISLRPYSARKQVVVIDGAERLTEEAANSLLKSLEEPSASTHFLLVTAHLAHCLPTVRSRCQIIRCDPLSRDMVGQILVQGRGCEPQMAAVIARLCGGSVSRAIELAEQWAGYQHLLEQLGSADPARWIGTAMPETRQDVVQLLDGMMGWLRDLAVTAVADPQWVTHASQQRSLTAQAEHLDVDRCVATAFELLALRDSIEQFVSPRLVASLAREKWLSLLVES